MLNIRQMTRNDIPECVRIIRESFRTVAEQLGITEQNAPRFTAFATDEDRLLYHMDAEHRPMYVCCDGEEMIGYYSLRISGSECELGNLCVLPEYRHGGAGAMLLRHSLSTAKENGCDVMKLGIVEENEVLRRWYESFGFTHTGAEKFDFFPFTCGYMEKKLG